MFGRSLFRSSRTTRFISCAARRLESSSAHQKEVPNKDTTSAWQPITLHPLDIHPESTVASYTKASAATNSVDDPAKVIYQPLCSNEYDARLIAKRIAMADRARKRTGKDHPVLKRRKISPGTFLPQGSTEEILDFEVAELLTRGLHDKTGHKSESGFSQNGLVAYAGEPTSAATLKPPAELNQQVELEIIRLSSTGDGLALTKSRDHVIVVPFTVPEDRVLAKPWKWQGKYTIADFIEVVRPSPRREGVTPKCPYFSKCSGCQFQMLPYNQQLEHKRKVVQAAFKHFSGLGPDKIPKVQSTLGSPLQYNYRTKLSPHFDGPRKWGGGIGIFEEVPPIGFNRKNDKRVMDIESCPIGVDILQEGFRIERKRVADNLDTFKNGATLNMRESTKRSYRHTPSESAADDGAMSAETPQQDIPSNPNDLDLQSRNLTHSLISAVPKITFDYATHTDEKTYTTDLNSLVHEYITTTTDPTTTPPSTRTYKFSSLAGSFFQNNNSILGPFTSYIYSVCLPPNTPSTPQTTQNTPATSPIKYLLDAYCGSGLFTITLSSLFTSSLGIDVDARAIQGARHNAAQNLATSPSPSATESTTTTTTTGLANCGFIDADASALFADVPYPAHQTLTVIDPPRKGCDREFLRQLRRFGPKRVVYVSCNVHTQARDVGVLVDGFQGADVGWESGDMCKYEIESLRGFDFFPQTGHVEGVCVLNRVG